MTATSRVVLTLLLAASEVPRMSIPVDQQLTLFLKVLTADRNATTPSAAPLLIGVVFQQEVPPSRAAKDELLAAIERSRPGGSGRAPVRTVLFEVGSPDGRARLAAVDALGALYVAPLRDFPVERISSVSRARKILTVTGVPGYVDAGLAVGFEARLGSPLIIVNHEASLAEGADFSSKLLKLARVIHARPGLE